MPSPIIPRSKSAPDISSPDSPSNPIPSTKSIRSTRSTGSPIISWPKKFTQLITGKTKNISDLTEETLQEFNRRNALVEARYNSSSPYYKGLTDFSLVINREKLSGSSPGRESHATTFNSSGSKSSFVVRVQEWSSSCFTSKKHEKISSSSSSSSSLASSWTKSTSHDTRFTTTSSSSSSSSTPKITETVALTKIRSSKNNTRNESEIDKRKVSFHHHSVKNIDSGISSNTEKPLRERDYVQPSMQPVPPPTASPPESLPYPLPQITPPETPAGKGVIIDNKETNYWTKNEKKYVWADQYRPFWLREFLCNKKTAFWLQSVARNLHDKAEECGHFIFEGNPGVGKRTMIWALLREAFGEDKVQGEAVGSILVNLMVSPHHVEVNLSELKGYEKHVIVELIKEKSHMLSDATLPYNQLNYKAIILHDADKLSTDALSYIKWMLEKFKGSNKVFFCCSDAKKLQPIIPLCTYVQLLEPSIEEILEVLGFIAKREGIEIPHQLAYKIAINSKNNLRQAIRSFEATWHFNTSLTEDQDIKTGWEDKIANIARNVLEEQSPKQLYNIRGELQNLIEHNVAPEFIFQKNHAVKKYLSSENQQEELGKRQNDQRKNVQQFMRIEEFIARFMSWYKGLVIKNKDV
ncbi:hypothetical protein DH2020_002592 [Rehmannia glutinosa]|uniref:Uncharacterized protein n=1 Tax=Rehmannia glutinosa TaxID=99300 RepID=A0ABR0XUP0_REHGL